jgi:RNA polymerase sigma-70 factor (ECF subfamily)
MGAMTRAEEQRLIERAAAGDRAASETFIRAHQASLFAYLLRMSGRPEVAEDIVQEAFVRVLTNLDRFDPRYRFSTWLFTIAKRVYMNACQRHKPAYDSDAIGARQGTGAAPEARTVEEEIGGNARDALQAALLALPTEQREVVVLFHQQDWPIWLIAQHMDMPEGTVKSHLHRGRKKMRRLLDASERHTRSVGEVWA